MYTPMALHDSFEVHSGSPHVPDRLAPIRCPEMEDKETTNTHSKLFYKSTDGEHLPHVVCISYTRMQRMHLRQHWLCECQVAHIMATTPSSRGYVHTCCTERDITSCTSFTHYLYVSFKRSYRYICIGNENRLQKHYQPFDLGTI